MLKNKDITLLTMVSVVTAMFFPVDVYEYESWTIKKAECRELMLSNCGVGKNT